MDETKAVLPQGWRDRLVFVAGENTRFVRGWCLEIYDLAISKYVAGREKDLDYTRSLARHGMATRSLLEQRLEGTSLDPGVRVRIAGRIQRDFAVAPGDAG
ncbi:hypothetical protein SBA3_4360008 [Candidatus Sulfopaludibacter sp. SbA3]|nr:hypothetical protein SBA3_4360008 [Candidatus Sulfopaludibacter sp. SbA3]